nr:hypothetical protein [Paenibacillus bovis]
MKDICIVGYNFGNKYMSFIPIYIYTILKSYPDYSVLIFTDNKLDNKTRSNLELLNGLGDFRVIENYDFGILKDHEIKNVPGYKKAMRWLFFDERFLDYKSIYIGDIDIVMCKENPGLYEQHVNHCSTLNLPYSNYIRLTTQISKPNIKLILKLLPHINVKTLLNIIRKKEVDSKRLSGLHFVKTEDYFNRVKEHYDYFINIIAGKTNKQELIEKYLVDDEVLLYDLVEMSGIGLPPISPDSPGMDYKNSSTISFRPHHGIHMGIFRSDMGVKKQQQVLNSYIYKEYIEQYKKFRNEEEFEVLIEGSTTFVKEQFKRMDEFYGIVRK